MKTQYIAAWGGGRTVVVWRGLTWSEYRKFTRQIDLLGINESPLAIYMDLYRALLVEGPELTQVAAGVVEWIGRAMLETNPFGGAYADVAHAIESRRGAQDYLENAKALVAGIFRYTFEEIESWDADIFFDRVAKAEFLAGKKLDPIDPEAVEREKQQKLNGKKHKFPTGREPDGYNGERKRAKKPMTEGQQLAWERVQEARNR